MNRGRLEVAMLHIVLARPKKLDWRLGRTRNLGCFQRVIDAEPSSESSAD
jgi:hypothetical protein